MNSLTFEAGVLFAAARLVDLHDQPGMAADILIEAGMQNCDCKDLDDCEREPLKLVQGERGGRIRLKYL